MKITEAIGANIRRAREANGMTQAQLGAAVALWLGARWSRQQVWSAEQGDRDFRIEELLALSAALGAPLPLLLAVPLDGADVAGVHWSASEVRRVVGMQPCDLSAHAASFTRVRRQMHEAVDRLIADAEAVLPLTRLEHPT